MTGCVSWRKNHLESCSPGKAVIWLDCDISFPASALSEINKSIDLVKGKYFVITPQLVRMWDETWDCLVHKDFREKELGYCYDYDVSLIEKISQQNSHHLDKITEFKFAGGWLTVISSDLLKLTGIPEVFKPYGEEDTYIMQVCEGLKKLGWPVSQYVMEGLLVAQKFNVFESAKKQFKIVNDKSADAAYNKTIKSAYVDDTLSHIGRYNGTWRAGQ